VSDLNSAAAEAASRYNIPLPVLLAVAGQESGMNPNTGQTRAPISDTSGGIPTGMMQMKPATASSMGVDPNDPVQALHGAARYLREGIDKTGSLDGAVRYYFGGPDMSRHGPKTEAYGQQVTSRALQIAGQMPQAAPHDPYEAALGGGAPASGGSNDPYEVALSGATPAPNAGLPVSSANANSNLVSGGAGSNAGGNVHNGGGGQAQSSG